MELSVMKTVLGFWNHEGHIPSWLFCLKMNIQLLLKEFLDE